MYDLLYKFKISKHFHGELTLIRTDYVILPFNFWSSNLHVICLLIGINFEIFSLPTYENEKIESV